jgi:predicted DCC family thiol-disulfide oxidoreductase YuxK
VNGAEKTVAKPILLYNDECAVCRHIAKWVQRVGKDKAGETRLVERAIGDDPAALRALSPNLDIWDAYATIHLLMPDGSMKLGGEAVAEVLRRLPPTRWLARSFSLRILGVRPFQSILNLSYFILADSRPIFGCESCGTPNLWVRPFVWVSKKLRSLFGHSDREGTSAHSNSRAAKGLQATRSTELLQRQT